MQKLRNLNIEDLLFIDIETVRIKDKLEEGTDLYDSFEYKMRYAAEADKFDGENLQELYEQKAPLYAEFAKICCITVGRVKDGKLNVKSYSNIDEYILLKQFFSDLEAVWKTLEVNRKSPKFVGHSIKGFDIPFIMRRSIINALELPAQFDTAHLKPWETDFIIDIAELWKSTSWYSASLLNMAVAMSIESPKSDISGGDVSDVYWKEGNLNRIEQYCERDVKATYEIYKKMAYIK